MWPTTRSSESPIQNVAPFSIGIAACQIKTGLRAQIQTTKFEILEKTATIVFGVLDTLPQHMEEGLGKIYIKNENADPHLARVDYWIDNIEEFNQKNQNIQKVIINLHLPVSSLTLDTISQDCNTVWRALFVTISDICKKHFSNMDVKQSLFNVY